MHMRLFIGSANPTKVNDWRAYFPDWEILSYEDLGLSKIQVEEEFVSLEDNARRKALAWAEASGEFTLSDDTGFFINALGGLPGVSVKRWGGRFEREMSQSELFCYLRQQVEGLDDLSCYFESVYALASSDGRVETFADRMEGELDRDLLQKDIPGGSPLGVIFRAKETGRIWREMTAEERRRTDQRVVTDIIDKVQKMRSNQENG